MLSRRTVLLAGLAGMSAGALLYARRVEPHWLEVVRRELPIDGLPPHLEGKTLAQISDLHVGPQVDDGYVIRTFERVARLGPDFVAVTGDWISYRDAGQLGQLARVLRHLPRGARGTVGILGNHDYGHGWKMGEVGEAVASIATGAGCTMLRNRAITLDGLRLFGLDDFWGPNFRPAALVQSLAAAPATIVLCHNPDVVDLPIWGTYRGWILAGHTHGGQCKPPFLPPPLLPVKNRRYSAGEFALQPGRRLYVNRGVGHLLRARFNVRPEVTLFRLRSSVPSSPVPS